jgi:hypothetical protein
MLKSQRSPVTDNLMGLVPEIEQAVSPRSLPE